jgi:hypothetical protein
VNFNAIGERPGTLDYEDDDSAPDEGVENLRERSLEEERRCWAGLWSRGKCLNGVRIEQIWRACLTYKSLAWTEGVNWAGYLYCSRCLKIKRQEIKSASGKCGIRKKKINVRKNTSDVIIVED